MRRAMVVATVVVVLAGCGWARPRFDAARTGTNPVESKITATNVAQLTRQFVAPSATAGVVPKFVVTRGHLYVGGDPIRTYDAVGVAGCSNASPRVCTPQWSLNSRGDPDVMGQVLYNFISAYDADGVTNCTGTPKVCTPIYQEETGSAPLGPTKPDALHFDVFRFVAVHGGEYSGISAFDSPCAPAPAACPFRWGTTSDGLGTSPNGAVLVDPVVGGSRVFAGYSPSGGNATLFAFDGTTGTAPVLWSATLDGGLPPEVPQQAEPLGAVGLAYGGGVVVIGVTTPSGPRLEAFDATGTQNCSGAPKKCLPIWVTDAWTGTGAEAPPALLNGRLYRAVGTQLRAYDLHGATSCSGAPKVCTQLWGVQVGRGVSGAVDANGLVYVGSADGTVHAYDTNGISKWTTNVGSPVGSVEVWDGHVYVGTADGRVRVYGLS